MEIQVAAAKVGKYAVSESGDTLEMIERPQGGLSFVLVDGQRSGRSAKVISNLVARKAVSLLAEGVRDGAAARAAHDYLYTHRQGKVLATLNIVSVDLTSRTLVVSRNNPAPALAIDPGGNLIRLDQESVPVGIYPGTKPVITEIPLDVGTTMVLYTDGLSSAGIVDGRPMDVPGALLGLYQAGVTEAQTLADALLSQAMELDHGRPNDDISVLVLTVTQRHGDEARRLIVRMPIPEQ